MWRSRNIFTIWYHFRFTLVSCTKPTTWLNRDILLVVLETKCQNMSLLFFSSAHTSDYNTCFEAFYTKVVIWFTGILLQHYKLDWTDVPDKMDTWRVEIMSILAIH